jgi:hypothetical protein
LIEKGSPYLAVFEGLFDALTWEQLNFKRSDLLILNSTANLNKAFEVMKNYKVIISALDNDSAGGLARRKIESVFEGKVAILEFQSRDLNEAYQQGKEIRLYCL